MNLVRCDAPADAYSLVLKHVKKSIDEDVAETNSELAKTARDMLSRSLIKQTVMTSVYGITPAGARRQITNHIDEIGNCEIGQSNNKSALARSVLALVLLYYFCSCCIHVLHTYSVIYRRKFCKVLESHSLVRRQ